MLSFHLQSMVRKYATGLITLDQLVTWLRPRELDLVADPESLDADLVSAVELGLANVRDGQRDEAWLRAYLYGEWRQSICASDELTDCESSTNVTSTTDVSVTPQVPSRVTGHRTTSFVWR